MLYISGRKENGYYVTDTDDNTTEFATKEELLIASKRINIIGVSKTGTLIYPVVPTDTTKSGFMYIGEYLGKSSFDMVLTDDYVPDDFVIPSTYSLKNIPSKKIYSTRYLMGIALKSDNITLERFLVSVVKFLDYNWESEIRRVRLKVYYSDETIEEIDVTCYLTSGTLLRLGFDMLSYIDIDAMCSFILSSSYVTKNEIEFVTNLRGFCVKYSVNKVDYANMQRLTEENWDSKGLVYLSRNQTIPAATLLKELFDLTAYYVTDKNGVRTSCKRYNFPTKFMTSKVQNPIFREFYKLFFEDTAYTLGDTLFDMSGTASVMSVDKIVSEWKGDCCLIPMHKHRQQDDNLFCGSSLLTSLYMNRNRLVFVWGCYDRSRGAGDRDLENKVSGEYTSLRGRYYFDKDAFLDFTGYGVANNVDARNIAKAKLLTGNSGLKMNAKGEVSGIKPQANGMIVLPDGGKSIGVGGLDLNRALSIYIPPCYKRRCASDFIKRSESGRFSKFEFGDTLLIRNESQSLEFLSSFMSGLLSDYAVRQSLEYTKVRFESKNAKSQTAASFLYSNISTGIFSNQALKGMIFYIEDLEEEYIAKAVAYVWEKCFRNGEAGHPISFCNRYIRTTVEEFNVLQHLLLPTKVTTAIAKLSSFHLVLGDALERRSPSFRNYSALVTQYLSALRSEALSALRNAGFIKRDGSIYVEKKQKGPSVDKQVFGDTAYLDAGDDGDLGW